METNTSIKEKKEWEEKKTTQQNTKTVLKESWLNNDIQAKAICI